MIQIKWSLSTGFAGCDYEGEFLVEDDATDDEIEEKVKEEAFNNIDWGWNKVLKTQEEDEDE